LKNKPLVATGFNNLDQLQQIGTAAAMTRMGDAMIIASILVAQLNHFEACEIMFAKRRF
jgi:hypothetical protein